MTLTEMLLSLGLVLIVAAMTLGVVEPLFQDLGRRGQVVEVQQRGRAARLTLGSDLRRASVPARVRGLASPRVFPSLLPGVSLNGTPLGAGGVTLWSALDDGAVTLPDALATAQSWLSLPVSTGLGGGVTFTSAGWREGGLALLSDVAGRTTVARVVERGDHRVRLVGVEGRHLSAYAAGAVAVPVTARSYVLDLQDGQLRRHLDLGAGVPVLDNVVDLQTRVFAAPGSDTWTVPPTCGSRPPASGVPVGELVGGLVELTADRLADGPWCDGDVRFDADLLRVRRVAVTLRLQAVSPAFRGREPTLFARPGDAFDPARWVRDHTVTITGALRVPWQP